MSSPFFYRGDAHAIMRFLVPEMHNRMSVPSIFPLGGFAARLLQGQGTSIGTVLLAGVR